MKEVMKIAMLAVLPFIGLCQASSIDYGETLLTRMHGVWSGQGKYMGQSKEWVETRVEEVVDLRLNGRVLIIEGKGYSLEDTIGLEPVHHAIAMLHYDDSGGGMKMRAVLKDGRWVDPTISMTDQGFNWSFEVPGGAIEYCVSIDKDRWVEKGYFCRGDEKWPFFEMDLTKQTNN